MSHPNPTASPLLIADLIDLDRDPRPGAQYRALTGLATPQLAALEGRITTALPRLTDSFQRSRLASLRARPRWVLRHRIDTGTYAQLLAEAV